MATLLYGSTFNSVKVWGGNNNSTTNTFVGYCSGEMLNGYNNTIFGYKAGRFLQCGDSNTVMGAYSFRPGGGPSNPNFSCTNVAFGVCSMHRADGDICDVTAIGFRALGGGPMQPQDSNVAIGGNSSYFNVAGSKNTFVGQGAGLSASGYPSSGYNTGIGAGSLSNIRNGYRNTAIGNLSLCGILNGTRNVAIGGKANGNCNVGMDYTIVVGYNTNVSTNKFTMAGNSNMTGFYLGASSWITPSDKRDKTEIELIDENLGLNFIRKLRPVKFNFDFRLNYVNKCNFEYGVKDNTLKQQKETYGLIAQEVESTLIDIQTDFDSLRKDDKGDYSLVYESLISPIVKSLQQTIQRLEFLESKV